jgi:hypothetical protein
MGTAWLVPGNVARTGAWPWTVALHKLGPAAKKTATTRHLVLSQWSATAAFGENRPGADDAAESIIRADLAQSCRLMIWMGGSRIPKSCSR